MNLARLFVVAPVLMACLMGAPPTASAAPELHYELNAKLDPQTNRLVVTEHITFQHSFPALVPDLYFHLYWNAFRSPDSTYYHEAALIKEQPPSDVPPKADSSAGIMVKRFSVDEVSLLDAIHFVRPDATSDQDTTVLRVMLPTPLAPATPIQIDLEYEARIPPLQDRSGVEQTFYFIGQWYPKLGVLETVKMDDGEILRWNCHQFHYLSEFFSDFATYDLNIVVPANFVVGASGHRSARQLLPDGTVQYRFQQEKIHDVAWTAWPEFAEFDSTWKAPDGHETTLHFLTPVNQQGRKSWWIETASATLDYLSSHFFVYPYTDLTVVAVPPYAHLASGMEYPTLVTTESPEPGQASDFEARFTLVHEIVHQYFYGLLASNEFSQPWLDEGITSYVTNRILEEYSWPLSWSPTFLAGFPARLLPLNLSGDDLARMFKKAPILTPPASRSWDYLNADDYFQTVYDRTTLALGGLESLLGREAFDQQLASYARTFAYRHPSTSDFVTHFSSQFPVQVSLIARQFLFGTRAMDYSIRDARCLRSIDAQYEIMVVAERIGDAQVPVTVTIDLENGQTQSLPWDGFARWQSFRFTANAPAILARISSPTSIWLDTNRLNDAKRALTIDRDGGTVHLSKQAPPDSGALRLLATFSLAFQSLLALLALIV